MSSSPWRGALGEGDEDVATPFQTGTWSMGTLEREWNDRGGELAGGGAEEECGSGGVALAPDIAEGDHSANGFGTGGAGDAPDLATIAKELVATDWKDGEVVRKAESA
jgi:hypothetical protein